MTTPMKTSIYNNAIQFAENEKKNIQDLRKSKNISARQAQKSMEEIEDFLWVVQNAGKVRGSIIEYGDQVAFLVEENQKLRDRVAYQNNILAQQIQRMREPKSRMAFGAGASLMDQQKPSSGLAPWW